MRLNLNQSIYISSVRNHINFIHRVISTRYQITVCLISFVRPWFVLCFSDFFHNLCKNPCMSHQFYFLYCVVHDINLGYHRSVDLSWTLSCRGLIHHTTFIPGRINFFVDIYDYSPWPRWLNATRRNSRVPPFFALRHRNGVVDSGPVSIVNKLSYRKMNKTSYRQIL